ncbi:MAG: hypothetical protein FWC27_10080 [Firmicutes bacterium]|nr:hypothetical protein [Bacillota bacterium]
MVVVLLLKAIFGLLKLLIMPFNLPDLPALDDVYTLISYITTMAYNMVYLVLPRGTVSVLFAVLVLVIAARYLYKFVMWVIKKIPGGMS